MNKSVIFAAIAALSASLSVNAATITLTNFDGTNDYGGLYLSDQTTKLENVGFAQIGTFSSDPVSIGDLASFTQFGTTVSELSVGSNSFIQGDLVGPLATFDGSPVYVVVGNGTTIANSTEVFVWKSSGANFGNTEPIGTPNTIVLSPDTGTFLIGTTFSGDSFGQGVQNTFVMQAVPESSAILLCGLGGLMLLRRRRND